MEGREEEWEEMEGNQRERKGMVWNWRERAKHKARHNARVTSHKARQQGKA